MESVSSASASPRPRVRLNLRSRIEGKLTRVPAGEDSSWFGTVSKEPVVWEYRGHALAGFMGTSSEHITGLKVSSAPSSAGTLVLTSYPALLVYTRPHPARADA